MNIIIKDSNAAQNIIDQSSIRWKFYTKKTLMIFLLMFLSGLFLFITGMEEYSGYGWKLYNGEYAYYTNWHLMESFGFVILFITAYMLIAQFNAKKKFFKAVNALADRHLKTTNEILIQVTEDCVRYRSYELSQEIKWWLFNSYTFYGNYLFLNLVENPKACVTIDKRLMSANEFSNLLEFVKKRLAPKF